MSVLKNILVIVGSAGANTANEQLVKVIADLTKETLQLTVFNQLKTLPHFDPELSINNPPEAIVELRKQIERADGIIICTPEYIFSIPSGLKNLFEWCVATTVFDQKPTGLITASAHGQKGHEELQLIASTVMTKFTAETTLLISGIKGKFNENGTLTDPDTSNQLLSFINAYHNLFP